VSETVLEHSEKVEELIEEEKESVE